MNTHIENEAAYEAGKRRNIIANARKTWRRTTPDYEVIENWLDRGRGEVVRGVQQYLAGFAGSLARAFDNYGKLTDKQAQAVRDNIAKAVQRRAEWADKKAAIDAQRQWVGEVGKKVTLTVTTRAEVDIGGLYGPCYLIIMEDEQQNTVIYKGNSGALPRKGETTIITATVKEHGVRDGVKQTIIQRPKEVV